MGSRGHVPLRRCVGCRRVRPQAELLRLVQGDTGAWQLDLARRAGGRGSWVCQDTPDCWTPKRLGRSFRAQTEAVCTLLAQHAAQKQQLAAEQTLAPQKQDAQAARDAQRPAQQTVAQQAVTQTPATQTPVSQQRTQQPASQKSSAGRTGGVHV